jgi:tetratricopeptide (TPR) repeat protein
LTVAAFGRDSEAIDQVGKGLELDPLSVSSNSNAGAVYCELGRYGEAAEQFRRTLELDPTPSAARGGLALAYSYQRRFDDALREYAEAQRINGTIVQFAGPAAIVYAQMGKGFEARQILNELMEISKSEHVPSYNFVLAYVAAGDRHQAFYWLEKAAQERELTVVEVNTDQRIDSLRSDPRFLRLRADFHLADTMLPHTRQ